MTQRISFSRVEADIGGHRAHEQMLGRAQALHADMLAPEIRDAADASFANSSKQPACKPANTVTAIP